VTVDGREMLVKRAGVLEVRVPVDTVGAELILPISVK
jgi:hypothetical protein